jgi:hypothetical protein
MTRQQLAQATSAPVAAPMPHKPTLGHWIFHIGRSLRLMRVLLLDRRVPFIRKFFFLGAIIIFGMILIVPDTLIAGFFAAILPFVGLLFGIPISGIVDIAVLAFLSYGLLRFFPHDLVREHSQQLYGPNADVKPHFKAL